MSSNLRETIKYFEDLGLEQIGLDRSGRGTLLYGYHLTTERGDTGVKVPVLVRLSNDGGHVRFWLNGRWTPAKKMRDVVLRMSEVPDGAFVGPERETSPD